MNNTLSRLCLILTLTGPLCAENWPSWRGPRHDGTSKAARLPLTWSKTDNVVWRTPLAGPAPSTPVIWDNRIFLTGTSAAGHHARTEATP